MASKSKWAYLAGIFDGEGSVSISRTRLQTPTGKTYWGYDCKVLISNTDPRLMKWLVSNFGGSFRPGNQKNNAVRATKPCFRWAMESYPKQEKFLLAIIPYLIIKKEQALLALQFTRMKDQKNPAERERLHLACIALNSGNSPTTNMSNTSITEEVKIESELHGDMQSEPVVTLAS